MVIDYTGLSDIVAFITKEITSTDGEVGNRRAIHFEKMVVEEIESVFGNSKTWICRKEIIAENNKKEIDASFIIDDFLFIIEAKAVNVSFGYDKGDKRALDFRTNKMKSAIQESNEKVDFMINNLEILNPKLPKNIKYLVPIVISSYPEYIWEKTDELFISEKDGLPRVMTIGEIKKLKIINHHKLKNKSWVLSV